jgi:hypothetical protein
MYGCIPKKNSWEGYDCFKAFSYDGESHGWRIQDTDSRLSQGVTGFLQDGTILMTYRFITGWKTRLG